MTGGELVKCSCLGAHGDGPDDIWDEGSDFLHAFSHTKGYVVVSDPEFAHEEERLAKEIIALCNAETARTVALY